MSHRSFLAPRWQGSTEQSCRLTATSNLVHATDILTAEGNWSAQLHTACFARANVWCLWSVSVQCDCINYAVRQRFYCCVLENTWLAAAVYIVTHVLRRFFYVWSSEHGRLQLHCMRHARSLASCWRTSLNRFYVSPLLGIALISRFKQCIKSTAN